MFRSLFPANAKAQVFTLRITVGILVLLALASVAFSQSTLSQTLLTTQRPNILSINDGQGVYYELGTRLYSDVPGQITAIRFWKSASEWGSHVGHIWNANGSLLATVTFTNETASGWQQQSLPHALSISANSELLVSVNTGAGYYVVSDTGLSTAIVNGHLHSIVGGNGRYGAPGAYPRQTYLSSNYFRDVVFVPASAGGGSTGPISISLSPIAPKVSTGGKVQFSATVSGAANSAVTWSTTGGAISTSGLYTAPTTAGTYTVKATSVADTTKAASTTVTVTANSQASVAVAVSPNSASLQTGGSQQFIGTVTGTTNTAVTWSATGGTVSSSGLYTAPSSTGTYTLTATSTADTTKKASATVTVTAPAAISVSITPSSTALAPNANTTFTANVSNSSNTAVTWTASGGTISGTGNSITYTAPASTGTYTVTATSIADTSKQGTATVTDASNSVGKFEGYGANATGGSKVVHVTNTSSSGSGSFAAAIASSGNHVVFDVGGTISGTFYIPSNTTIDGFSAPSPGITFTGGTGSAGILNIVDVNNIIIQGVRIRGGSGMPDNTKGIMFYESAGTNHDIVVDHCEIDNVTDEDIGSSGHNVTVSWNLLGAPASSGGELIKYDAYQWSVHHNLWIDFTGNDSRIPLVWAGDDTTANQSWNGSTIADYVGNVAGRFLYGLTYVTDGTLQDHSNIINNYFDGQDSNHASSTIDIMASGLEKHYLGGNAVVLNPAGTPSTYGCGVSNLCGTIAVLNSNTLSCGSLTGCQPSTSFSMPTITTSCVYDNAGRITEWNNVINNAGVITHYADDATSSALRAVVTKPSATILGQSWNQQTGTCP